MKTVGLFEAKTHFSALVEAAEKGETVTITRRGKPVAKLIAHEGVDRERVAETIEKLLELRKGASLGGLDWKELRDEGRR